MHRKSIFVSLLFLFLMGLASRLEAQVTYSAREGRTPLSVGFGVADFRMTGEIEIPVKSGSRCGLTGVFPTCLAICKDLASR